VPGELDGASEGSGALVALSATSLERR